VIRMWFATRRDIWALKHMRDGSCLRVISSQDKRAAQGHIVVAVTDANGKSISVKSRRWSGPSGGQAGAGFQVTLEAADSETSQELNNYADEGWLFQVRQVLDVALGRVEAPANGWDHLRIQSEGSSPRAEAGERLAGWKRIFGAECFGYFDTPETHGEETFTSDEVQSNEEEEEEEEEEESVSNSRSHRRDNYNARDDDDDGVSLMRKRLLEARGQEISRRGSRRRSKIGSQQQSPANARRHSSRGDMECRSEEEAGMQGGDVDPE